MSVSTSNRTRFLLAGDYAGLMLVLAALVAFFSYKTDSFFSTATLTAIVNDIPALTLVSIGMTFVLITGGIDLAVGSVLACSAAVLGTLMVNHSCSVWLAVPLTLLAGCCCGTISGCVSVLAGIPSFIVSLGVLQIARGLANVLTESNSIFIERSHGIQVIGSRLAGLYVSPAFLLSVLVVVVAQVTLHRTLFGRYCMAIGYNEKVVRFSGIDTRWTRIGAFAVSGMLAAAAGIVDTARLSAVAPNDRIGFELPAIAAAVIGGTSLLGGRGSMVSTLFGVLIISVLQAGLSQMGVSEGAKYITTGSVIVLAVLLDASRSRLQQLLRQFFR